MACVIGLEVGTDTGRAVVADIRTDGLDASVQAPGRFVEGELTQREAGS